MGPKSWTEHSLKNKLERVEGKGKQHPNIHTEHYKSQANLCVALIKDIFVFENFNLTNKEKLAASFHSCPIDLLSSMVCRRGR